MMGRRAARLVVLIAALLLVIPAAALPASLYGQGPAADSVTVTGALVNGTDGGGGGRPA